MSLHNPPATILARPAEYGLHVRKSIVCGTTDAEEDLNFGIAPTICMKTKANFRPNAIAPTILMKINELTDFRG